MREKIARKQRQEVWNRSAGHCERYATKLQPVSGYFRRVRDPLRTPPHEELMEPRSFDLLMKEIVGQLAEAIEADLSRDMAVR
jgi:hypothetical protein